MTDKQKARVGILANQFIARFKEENPYSRGARVWEWWYSHHPRTEPIPKEMLPTEEQYKIWDRKEAVYVVTHLKDYEAKLDYWQDMLGSPEEEAIAEEIARTVPCECREAQCNFFCPRYGMENCCEDNL